MDLPTNEELRSELQRAGWQLVSTFRNDDTGEVFFEVWDHTSTGLQVNLAPNGDSIKVVQILDGLEKFVQILHLRPDEHNAT